MDQDWSVQYMVKKEKRAAIQCFMTDNALDVMFYQRQKNVTRKLCMKSIADKRRKRFHRQI